MNTDIVYQHSCSHCGLRTTSNDPYMIITKLYANECDWCKQEEIFDEIIELDRSTTKQKYVNIKRWYTINVYNNLSGEVTTFDR